MGTGVVVICMVQKYLGHADFERFNYVAIQALDYP
ncbi:hypothetical protein SAMN05428967_0433 [Phyllobacterium sp. YR620]|nr:hypothetical protein SAMN05428967_0433 [Phyllobacterium sp. YR620]